MFTFMPTRPTTPSLAFVLGLTMAGKGDPEAAAKIYALTDELRRRGVWDDLLAALDPAWATRLRAAESLARGQAWSRTGQRPPRSV